MPDQTTSDSDNSPTTPTWITETLTTGSLPKVDLNTGTNGWASPPGSLFNLCSNTHFTKKHKPPTGDYLLTPVGVDWLKSTSKLGNILSRRDNRIMHALRNEQNTLGTSRKAFVFAINLQIPGRDHYSAVFYYAACEGIENENESLFWRFVNGGNEFRNARFKMVHGIVKGPWIVKTALRSYGGCLLGKALKIDYYRGDNYLEVDVDIGSSAVASAVLCLALGCVTSVVIDMGFVIEGQEEDELPEMLIGAVRICQMELSSATFVEAASEVKRG